MDSIALTENELEIMELLWRENRPLSRSEVIELSPDRSWKASSIHILLNKLLEKGAICVKGFVKTGKNYGRTYFPNITPEEHFVMSLKQSNYYKKSEETAIMAVFAALIKDDNVSCSLLDEFEQMIEERKVQLEKR